MAAKLWNQVLQFQVASMPKSITGQIHKFKHQYIINKHMKHKETAILDIEQDENQLETMYKKLKPYFDCNIYNKYKTAPYQKTFSDKTLATIQIMSGKVTKDRNSANFCYYAVRTDKLLIQFIGMSAKKHCYSAGSINIFRIPAIQRNNNQG